MNDAEMLLKRARANGLTIATAESCTGGMIATAITEVAGSSDIFDRSYVTYSNAAKRDMLGVSQSSLDTYGAVSEPVAREMAEGALRQSGVDIAVAVTGIAGPGGSEFKPEGRVCFGLARKSHPTRIETVEFGALGRQHVRRLSTEHALALLLGAVG